MNAGLSVDVVARRESLDVRARFEARRGETLALLGPNGAGKSTVAEVLAGMLAPSEGRVVLDGRTLDDPLAGVRVPSGERACGVVFQDLLLLPHLTALENVAFPLRARGATRETARARAREMLDRTGVAHRESARPRALSGGEAQRVALARALIGEPRLLLLDEPLSSLDVSARSGARALLRATLAAFDGVSILVSHDPTDVMTLARRIVILEKGRVTHEGTPDEIRDAPRSTYAAELVGLNRFEGVIEPLGDGAAVLRGAHGEVVVAPPQRAAAGSEAMALVRPADVTVYRSRPDGSARNLVHGRVESIALDADRARVRISGAPAVVAEVTVGSLKRLGIAEGDEVWASFKAVEVRLVGE